MTVVAKTESLALVGELREGEYFLREHIGKGKLGETPVQISTEMAARDLFVEVQVGGKWHYVVFHVPWEEMTGLAVDLVEKKKR